MNKLYKIIYSKYQRFKNYNSIKNYDIVLTSFPKSGNTWLRFIFANIINEYLKLNNQIDFFSIQHFVPDMHKKNIRKVDNYPPFPKIIKTHDMWSKKFKNVIYLIRNPEEVMISHFRYLKEGEGLSLTQFDKFLRNKKYGIERWLDHVKSYREKCKVVIKYEDILENPKKEIVKVSEFLNYNYGIYISEDILEKSIKNSTRINMAKIEENKGRPYSSGNYKFVGINRKNIKISSEDREYINQQISSHLGSNFRVECLKRRDKK